MKILIIVVVTVFVLSACGTLVSTEPANEVKVGETTIKVTEINFGMYVGNRVTDNKDDLGMLGGYKADPGFRYAELVIEVLQGASAEEIYKWAVTLQDSEGNLYDVTVRGWGVMLGGENSLNWIFIIPENASPLKLIFPEGESIDLSPLLSNK